MNILKSSTLVALCLLSASPLFAVGFEYDWTGGASGFSGKIIMDAQSGIGDYHDILSATITVPNNGSPLTLVFTPPPNSENVPLTWNATGITAMKESWNYLGVPGGPSAILGAGSLSYIYVTEYRRADFDSSGKWLAAPVTLDLPRDHVPDTAPSILLLLTAAAALGVYQWAQRPRLAVVRR